MATPVPYEKDAYGREMWAFLHGGPPFEVVERDDGYVDVATSAGSYFAPFRRWPKRQRQAIRFFRGSLALDVGCGAGRVALYIQDRGLRVTAIDNSPLAIRTARKRGVKGARLLAFEDIGRLPRARFDTIVMFGNNFGLFQSYRKAKRLLRVLHRITSDHAILLAESINPYKTANPAHLEYQRRNRGRGRMPGQIRIRIRFQECIGPWFDYLFVSPDELNDIIEGTGWTARRFIKDEGPQFVAVIEKT